MSVSKKEIERRTGNNPYAFCYPNYLFNKEIRNLVKEAGYHISVCGGGFNFKSIDEMALRRIMIHEEITSSQVLFACWISGIFHFFRIVN